MKHSGNFSQMFHRMSWFWAIIVLTATVFISTGAEHQTVVVGSVFCDTCFQQGVSRAGHFIAGASVVVECKGTSYRPSFREQVTTNNYGEFKVHLPFLVSKHANKIMGCSVRRITSKETTCPAAAAKVTTSLRLQTVKNGVRIFSAGIISFKPQLCHQNTRTNLLKNPDLPTWEGEGKEEKASELKGKRVNQLGFPFPPVIPPIPLLPPPSLIPPVVPSPSPTIPPLLPSPPSSIIPPILPVPQIPLLPFPPSPPPPAFPIPLPPLPLPPVPLPPLPVTPVPGIPPADESHHESRT